MHAPRAALIVVGLNLVAVWAAAAAGSSGAAAGPGASPQLVIEEDAVRRGPRLVACRGGPPDLKDQIDVRLTTITGYEPFMGFDQHDMPPPALALYYFLLHLSIQMRLDKFDGVGNVAWADDLSVDATVAGFLAGLERRNDLNECCGSAGDFLTLLKSFTAEDLGNTVVPIAAQFKQTKDYPVIEQHLKKHVARLYLILQNYPLKYHQTTYAQSAK